jgi:TonB family protein
MASYFSKSRPALGILALVMAGWIAAIPAAAQSDPPPPDYIVLDRGTASRLLVDQVKPEYPPVAKVNFIQGQVRVQVIVTPEGRVGEAHVVRGHPFLAASALKAISHWVYRPFVKRSVPTAFQTFVDVNFQLRPKKIEDLPIRPERDLIRRIHPPEILDRPSGRQATASVRLRILLSDKGRVIDSLPVAGLPAHYDAARKEIERWTFRPARWGALSVPWYLDVDVPVENPPLEPDAGDPGGR